MNTGLYRGVAPGSVTSLSTGWQIGFDDDLNPGTPTLTGSFQGAGGGVGASPAQEGGRIQLGDLGSAVGTFSIVQADASAWARLQRIDGGFYISKNAHFSHAGSQAWYYDSPGAMAALTEMGEGIHAMYLTGTSASTGPRVPVSWNRFVACKLDGTPGTTGNPVLVLEQRTKFGPVTSLGTVNATVEIFAQASKKALYTQGVTSVPILLTRDTAGSTNVFDLIDGPDVNNSGYLLFGIDPTGGTVGCTQGGVFLSTQNNGTGSTYDMVMHQRGAKDISLWTNNVERFRLFGVNTSNQGVGTIKIFNATTAPTANASGGGLLYATAGAGTWRGSSGTTTTFGPAEPHCPDCGRDFAHAWENPAYGRLELCMWCVTEQLMALGVTRGIIAREEP